MKKFHPDDHKIIDLNMNPIEQVKQLFMKLFPRPEERAGIVFAVFAHACRVQGMSEHETLEAGRKALAQMAFLWHSGGHVGKTKGFATSD